MIVPAFPLPWRSFFFLLLIFSLAGVACNTMPREDKRVGELQKEVARLSEENKNLEQSLKQLRQEFEEERDRRPVVQTQSAPSPQRMTLEQMKIGVQPVLEEVIRKIKASADTPKKGKQFGMRVEYDLPHAVFGLVQNHDARLPYSAKVIVGYKKYLESQKESRAYSDGSQEFHFVYRDQKWVYLESQ